MQWKIWVKEKTGTFFKLGHPKELPSRVGRHLVVELNHDPDWVWSLKMVTAAKENSKELFDFRIFDPETARAEGLDVKDYDSLENHPEAILFKGWYDRKTWEIKVIPVNARELEPQTH